jgi:hypothetical protein
MEDFDNELFNSTEFRCLICNKTSIHFTYAYGEKPMHWLDVAMICPTHKHPDRFKELEGTSPPNYITFK